MVIAGGDLPSETRSPYHKPDRPQQLFVDFRIDFINKMLIIGFTIEREPEESAMSELGIYEGCYVELRNGDVVGPVSKASWSKNHPWRFAKMSVVECWNENGTHYEHEHKDVVRVMPADAIKLTMSKTYGDFSKLGQATIPPHVTKAAMDAGIKAEPAYEQFVNAILTAGFKAQYGIGFVPVTQPAPINMDELCERLASALPVPRPLSECSDEMKEKLRKIAEAAVSYLSEPTGYPENESENRIPDSEKLKGGLSDFLPFYEPGLAEKITDTGREVLKSLLPLEGVTICFTGSMNTPVDTHKGIAEALGAKVSGSVHSNTTLVVFGVGALSKLDKAIEHDLPRMSESAWLWMAGLLGYGKPDQVSPYGKFHTGGIVGLRRGEVPAILSTDYVIPKVVYDRMSEQNFDAIKRACADPSVVIEVKAQNESENRISDSEKPKGGLSAIPSLREIHGEVLAEVRDWHAKYGRDSMPSTFSIAKAFHRMLTPVATEEKVHLVAPEGWYLYECKHEHTAHRFAGQTVTPSDHPGGAWSVDFQRLANGGMLTGGRGKTLVEAWQNAVAAIKLAEERGLDI